MKKRLFYVLLSILFVCCFCGCSGINSLLKIVQNSKLEIGKETEESIEYTQEIDGERGDEALIDESGMDTTVFDSIEKVIAYQDENYLQGNLGYYLSDFLYIYDGLVFEDTRNATVPIESVNYFNTPDIMWVTNKEEKAVPVIDRENGDQLILVISEYVNSRNQMKQPTDTSYKIYQLDFTGYCIPSTLDLRNPTGAWDPMMCFLENKISDGNEFRVEIDEIEGHPVSNTEFNTLEDYENYIFEILSAQGYSIFTIKQLTSTYCYIIGEPGEKLTFGKYEGTMYQEYARQIDANLYSGNSVADMTPRPTKDGYMIYDLSQFEPGIYIFLNRAFIIK